jgi:hypothetical protein
MVKAACLFILLLNSIMFLSCNGTGSRKKILKIDNYTAGDCFEFKEKIKEFGVIFLGEKDYPDGKQFNLFPVKLDTTKNGLDRFKYGKVYITGFPDFTKPHGRTEGFMVYHFLHQKDYQVINKFFKYTGALNIRNEYKNHTGGTSASNLNEFRIQLNLWEKMFGTGGRLVSVNEIEE